MEGSIPKRIFQRELISPQPSNFFRKSLVERHLIERLRHARTLRGHTGCVNSIQWNRSGSMLVSGSDDLQVCLWNVDGKQLHSFNSGHTSNIFSVQFLPCTGDEIIISASGDTSVRMHGLSGRNNDPHSLWWCGGRVKRLAVTESDPSIFWSAAEDGVVRQYDVRIWCESDLLTFPGKECKSLAINETRSNMIAVALNDAMVPIFDRRNLSKPMLELVPSHIPIIKDYTRHSFRTLTVTHVGFNSAGNEIIVNIGGEQIYIFNVLDKIGSPDTLQSLNSFLSNKDGTIHRNAVESLENKASERFRSLRERAKIHFSNKEYTSAIDIYSSAILECERHCGIDPSHSVDYAMDLCILLANRGACYLRRSWEGDVYASLMDSVRAMKIEPCNIKIYYRIVKALVSLKQQELAKKVIELVEIRFPGIKAIERLNSLIKGEPGEIEWKTSGKNDYVQRLCGHCNTNTDIKEAVWFGALDEYIAAGSDCGSLLIWERSSGELIKGFRADHNILNCVQPHPSSCMLATSGIDSVIRVWQPMVTDSPEDVDEFCRVQQDLLKLSADNQRRMNTGLFEMVFASITFAVHNFDDEEQNHDPSCTTS